MVYNCNIMRFLFYLLVIVVPFLNVSGQTGIGTTTPVNKFQVEATTTDPATSGASANGNFRLSGTIGSHVLDFGLSSSSTFSWLQSRSKSAYGTTYNLVLNPIGGRVGIGNTSPSQTLDVTGTGKFSLSLINAGARTYFGKDGANMHWIASADAISEPNNLAYGFESNGTSIQSHKWTVSGTEKMVLSNLGKLGLGTSTPGTSLHIENGNTFGTDPSLTSSPSVYVFNNNNTSTSAHSSLAIRTNGNGGGNPYLSFDIGGVRGYSMGIDNADGDKFKFQNNWNLNNSVTPILTITTDNKVGIGTASPDVPLHVASYVTQYVNIYGYLSQTNAQGSYGAYTNVNYSIQAEQRIRAPEFNAISDVRIKRDIVPLNTTKQLSDLNQLKVVNYSYIDQLVNGNKQKTGFIAQEVEKVNNQFVNQSTDFIPSVFAIAKATVKGQDGLQVTTAAAHGFETGDVVKFFAEGKKEVIKSIDVVTSADSFTVREWNEPTDNLFVYGKKVADFRAVDFDQITALSVGAIQELSKQIEKLQLENAALNKLINNKIQAKQSDFEKRLLQLESKLNKKKR
jgi:hypothetical protein